ncbi:MAG: DUF6508 domain-containing protein [Clostridium sp.]
MQRLEFLLEYKKDFKDNGLKVYKDGVSNYSDYINRVNLDPIFAEFLRRVDMSGLILPIYKLYISCDEINDDNIHRTIEEANFLKLRALLTYFICDKYNDEVLWVQAIEKGIFYNILCRLERFVNIPKNEYKKLINKSKYDYLHCRIIDRKKQERTRIKKTKIAIIFVLIAVPIILFLTIPLLSNFLGDPNYTNVVSKTKEVITVIESVSAKSGLKGLTTENIGEYSFSGVCEDVEELAMRMNSFSDFKEDAEALNNICKNMRGYISKYGETKDEQYLDRLKSEITALNNFEKYIKYRGKIKFNYKYEIS